MTRTRSRLPSGLIYWQSVWAARLAVLGQAQVGLIVRGGFFGGSARRVIDAPSSPSTSLSVPSCAVSERIMDPKFRRAGALSFDARPGDSERWGVRRAEAEGRKTSLAI